VYWSYFHLLCLIASVLCGVPWHADALHVAYTLQLKGVLIHICTGVGILSLRDDLGSGTTRYNIVMARSILFHSMIGSRHHVCLSLH
jgi:hypothetical protein